MTEMTLKNKLIWAAVGGLVVLGAVAVAYMILSKADEPPILVGDGSMFISSGEPLADLFDFDLSDPSVLKLKKANARIYMVKHTASIKDKDCKGQGCAVKTTWSNGEYSLEVTDTNGFTITSKPDFTTWDRESDPYIWRYKSLPVGAKNEGLNVTQGSSTEPPLCSGEGCAARIHYKSK